MVISKESVTSNKPVEQLMEVEYLDIKISNHRKIHTHNPNHIKIRRTENIDKDKKLTNVRA